jgi:hypothetical protein
MLRKLAEPEVTADNPFANDVLERKPSIERLTYLLESTKQPFVLSIEAPWGWGKTTFIRMWKAFLESKGHTCFHFNAWQNDFVDDPLVAFLGEMAKHIEKEKKELNSEEPIKKYLGEVKRIGAGVLRKALPLAVQVATHGLLNQEAVKQAVGTLSEETDKFAEFASTLAKERLDKYETERNGIEAFRLNLEKLAQEVVAKGGGISPLVFFIDEMDRCRPDFAIALLERIKYLFNVNQVAFVLAVDRTQLNQSVKALYGLESDPDGYLRRFIDLAYSLPPPTTERFVENLYRRFAMDECFGTRVRSADESRIWRTAFVHYAQALSLSLRVQEQCFTEMNIIWRTLPPRMEIYPAVLSFFSALRAYRPEIFNELRRHRISIDTITDWFAGVSDIWYQVWVEAALIHGFCNSEERRNRLEKFKEKYVKSTPNTFLDRPSQLADYLCHDGHSGQMLSILSQLEMSSQFR